MQDTAPQRLHIETRTLDALFDDRAAPSFPHTGRKVDEDLATYLESLARERRPAGTLEVEVGVAEGPARSSDEDQVRRDLRAFFGAERQIAELELRVNQREGWGFVRRAFPLMIGALAVAGVLYLAEPARASATLGDLVTALFYLLFITIVWVLLWDPTEKLLFDAYLLRCRIQALSRLEGASVRFVYRAASGTS